MVFKCTVCGMSVWLALELSGGPCMPSTPPHECHAMQPHTEIAMETETPPKALSTMVGSTPTHYVLNAEPGAYNITGHDATLTVTSS